MKKVLWLLCATVSLCACGNSNSSNNQPEAPKTKNLVLYYSQSGATKQVAELLQQKLGADIDSIVPVEPYNGDFQATIERFQKEMSEGIAPAIQPLARPVADYDTIYLGYPIWGGTYAPPVAGLLKTENLSGKVIVPFCTFGSGGLNTSADKLTEALPNARILSGYGVRNARVAAASAELDEFLIRAGIRSGEVEVLPDYSEPHAVSKEEAAIFDAACGSYPMPLGKPVTVASRVTSNSTQYVFETESKNPNSAPAKTHIYVTVGKAVGSVPEFIEVVR